MNRGLFQLTLLGFALAVLFGLGSPIEASAHEDSRYPNHHALAAWRTGLAPTASITPLFGNLGDHHHAITTDSELAQQYFDEGLILTFGFNHAEAIRSFQDALTLDPGCAMCYWGIALALGPNINAPMEPAAAPEAYAAIQQALALAPNVSPAEQAYIRALSARYRPDPEAERATLDLAYADAMRELVAAYPDDVDAATLFAEALMDLTPWQYWTKAGEATEYTAEIVGALESVLARDPSHPGANHYYIHAVEASQTPERAIPSAERLETLVPGAGHLVHMPAHAYWRVGRYHDAARVNEWAIRSDEQARRRGGVPDQGSHTFYFLAYYPHNIHFLFAAAQTEGRSQLAIEAARKLVAQIPEQAYRETPAIEDFSPMTLFALVRFGQWSEVLEQSKPAADLLYTTGMWHWVRGMAYLRLGQLEAAEREREQLAALAALDATKQQGLVSLATASTLLELAAHVLTGELAGARGDSATHVAELEAAIAIQDDLAYMEPPAWFYPVRQNLGAALLEAGRATEAETVYRADLRQYPNNGWSLFGLAASLSAQGRVTEAAEARQRFEAAWQQADVVLTSSRF